MSDIAPQPARGEAAIDERVDVLLRELRAQGIDGVSRAPRLHEPRRRGAALPALLEHGFPRSLLSEVTGPLSSGRTSFVLALLSRTTQAGEWVAWVEVSDAFDPASAAAAGVVLERVLWVRAPSLKKSLRAAERILEARGFASVILDLGATPGRSKRPSVVVPQAAWPRLRKRAVEGESAFVTLSTHRVANSFADLAFELGETRPCFRGVPAFFTGLEGEVVVARDRTGHGPQSALWKTEGGRVEIRAA